MMKRISFISAYIFIALTLTSQFSHSVPPGYISTDNGYCEEDNTKDEVIEVWWSNVGSVSSEALWNNTIIPELRNMAQRVQHVTLGFPEAPFVYADSGPPWNNGDPWSDTWGVCAYFVLRAYHGNSTLGPDPIRNIIDVNSWDNATRGLTPETTWRIVGVNNIEPNFIGWTKTDTKLTIIEKWTGPKVKLHEWGHCFEPEPDGDWNNGMPNGISGIYLWPVQAGLHYGEYSTPPFSFFCEQPWYGLNIMHFTTDFGSDGDYNWRHEKYPWFTQHNYDSYRWSENF